MGTEGGSTVHTGSGLWLSPDFPRTGWQFSRIDDAAEPERLCEACQNVRVRFRHVLRHEVSGKMVAVGLPCAERLLDDFLKPGKRERSFRDDLRIKSDWPQRVWSTAETGNLYINSRGFNVTIWPKGKSGFGITISVQNKFNKDYVRHGKKLFPTVEEAKTGALQAILWARETFRRQSEDMGPL